MIRILALTALLLPALAYANDGQQPAAPEQRSASPAEQALSLKLSQEINLGLQCSASLIGAQQDLAKTIARIKQLETKE